MADQIAHIPILVFMGAIPLAIATAMPIGRARPGKRGNTALPADMRSMEIEDEARVATASTIMDLTRHGT